MDSAAIAAGVAAFQSAGGFPFERAPGLTVLRASDGEPVELSSLWAPPQEAPATTLLVFGRNLL